MKNIGILYRDENEPVENFYYKKVVEDNNANPIMIEYDNISDLKECCGLIISGGSRKCSLDDIFIEYALENKLPLLGICQGMQSMAIYNSNEEIVSINSLKHQQKEGYVHYVDLSLGKVKDIYKKDKIFVNSHHLETVTGSKYFKVTGYSEDGLIEVVESSNEIFQIGVQWHPERMTEYDKDSKKLLKKFVDSCKARHL